MNKIWALFSIENNYDQPANNLVGWWLHKPSFETIANAMGSTFEGADEKTILAVVFIHQGHTKRLGDVDYRLEHIEEGVLKSQP